jgi:hypothetical protein
MEAGYTDFAQVRTDPDLEFLRADARFEVRDKTVQLLCADKLQTACTSEAKFAFRVLRRLVASPM